MSIKAVLFDPDGTLLPMDQDVFVKAYFSGIAAKLAPFGYEPKALIDTIWAGTVNMIKNDGHITNEEAFWNCFASIYGEKALTDVSLFEKFYEEDFDAVKNVCGYTRSPQKWHGYQDSLRYDRPHQRGDHAQYIQLYHRHHATAGNRKN